MKELMLVDLWNTKQISGQHQPHILLPHNYIR